MDYIDNSNTLSELINTLQLKISTIDAGDAASDDILGVNVVFSDGTRLYEPKNFMIYRIDPITGNIIGDLPGKGQERTYDLFVPHNQLVRTLGEITEVFIRKDGSNGWLVGSVLLYANGHERPLIGNSNVNQFLDDDDAVLLLKDWSTGSFCVAPATSAEYPLPRSGYRILGPVIGQVSDTSAVVLYRVDREGRYQFSAIDSSTGFTVHDQTTSSNSTHRFILGGPLGLAPLKPDTRYEFDLKFVTPGTGVPVPVPGAAGSLTTYPPDDYKGFFTFAFGSCANPREQAAQGSWMAIRSLAQSLSSGPRLFIHLGDTFYFYDDMTEEAPANPESMEAAHVSMRRHLEFLDMAREVPCCGIWDDHDWAGCNTNSTALDHTLRNGAVFTWDKYWGNRRFLGGEPDLRGISTRISYGAVDIYLLDGRIRRNSHEGVCFGRDNIDFILHMIDERGGPQTPRAVVLATGSNWNHHPTTDGEDYGSSTYHDEREYFFTELANRMGSKINGLILLSGDNHVNEIFHVELGKDQNGKSRRAPEFVSSPLTLNSDLINNPNAIEGERVASFPSGGENGKRGFTTLTIETHAEHLRWSASVKYFQEQPQLLPYASHLYFVDDGEFMALC